jgi:hypothetical protein
MLDRRRIPPFVVSDQGEEIGPGAWWQRREMVVALLHATCVICDRLRERLASHSGALREREAEQVTLSMDGSIGRDLAPRVAHALGLEQGVAFAVVADRYGEAFAAVPVHGADTDAVLSEIDAWLDHIQQQCPE